MYVLYCICMLSVGLSQPVFQKFAPSNNVILVIIVYPDAYLNAIYAVKYESCTMLRSDCCVVAPRCFPLAGRILCYARSSSPTLKDE